MTIYYNESLSADDVKRLKPIAADKSGHAPLSTTERAALRAKVLARLTISAPGKIVVYEQGDISSHWALSLGGNKIMSLNGAGQSVGIFPAGDLDNLLPPFWSNESDVAIAQTLLKDTVEYGLAPWEDYSDEDLEAASAMSEATDTSES